MSSRLSGLEKEIVEKNALLDSLTNAKTHDSDKIEHTKYELDKLLYLYYKALRCNSESQTILWCERDMKTKIAG